MHEILRYNSLREMADIVIDIDSVRYRDVGVELVPSGVSGNLSSNPFPTPVRIFVKRDLLEKVLQYLRQLEKPFHLLTGSSDLDGCEQPELASWMRANTKICSWTGTNLAEWFDWMLCVPIGLEERGRTGRSPEDFVKHRYESFEKRDLDIYVPFLSPTHPSRAQLLEQLRRTSNKRLTVETSRLSFSDYVKKLKRACFTLCPRGNGIDTVRAYEATYFESIPVVFSSTISTLHRRLGFLVINHLEEIYSIPNVPFSEIVNREKIGYSYNRELILKHQLRCFRETG